MRLSYLFRNYPYSYSGQTRGNTDQKISVFGHFLHSVTRTKIVPGLFVCNITGIRIVPSCRDYSCRRTVLSFGSNTIAEKFNNIKNKIAEEIKLEALKLLGQCHFNFHGVIKLVNNFYFAWKSNGKYFIAE